MSYPEKLRGLIPALFYFEKSQDRVFRQEMQELLGFRPKKLSHYRRAFVHKSVLNDPQEASLQSNERLEFLGDSVISLVIASYLYSQFPDQDEGFYSKMRARMVSRQFFNSLGYKLGLDHYLKQESGKYGNLALSDSMCGNAFEALMGAIFLDYGYQSVRNFFVKTLLRLHIDLEDLLRDDQNYKSRLLEWGQKHSRKIGYRLLNTQKEGHLLVFEMQALIDDEVAGAGTSTRKKEAEQKASKEALERLGLL